MIPSQPSLSWLKSLVFVIKNFYRKNKSPRIKITTLQKQKHREDLQHQIFFIITLQYIYKWMHPHQSDNTWLEIDKILCRKRSISDLPFLNLSIKHHQCFKVLTMSAALTLWKWWKFHKVTNSTLGPSKFTPIWKITDFLSNKKTLYPHSTSMVK